MLEVLLGEVLARLSPVSSITLCQWPEVSFAGSVEGKRQAMACICRTLGTGRMKVIQVDAGPHDLFEFIERMTVDRETAFVRRQVSAEDCVRTCGA